jgi:hypothetical protein
MCDAQQEDLTQSVADAGAQSQPLAAERLAKRAQKCGAEVVALRRVGWTKWSRPRAPKADGTRKVVWQTKTRQFLPAVRIGVLGALGTNAADIRESARSGSSTTF